MALMEASPVKLHLIAGRLQPAFMRHDPGLGPCAFPERPPPIGGNRPLLPREIGEPKAVDERPSGKRPHGRPRVNVDKPRGVGNAASIRIRVDEVVSGEESEHDEIGMVGEAEFPQRGQLLRRVRHRVARRNDVDPMRAEMRLEQPFEKCGVIAVTTAHPAEGIAEDEDAVHPRVGRERIIDVVEAEAIGPVVVRTDTEAEIVVVDELAKPRLEHE